MTCQDGDNSEIRLKTIYEHIFIDLYKTNNFLAIEQFKNWKDELTRLGFDQLMRNGIIESLEKAFVFQDEKEKKISIFQGENPLLRRWKLPFPIFTGSSTTTNEENEIGKNACAWVLEYGLNLVDDTGHFKFDDAKEVSWKTELNNHTGEKVINHYGGGRKVIEVGYKTLQERKVIKDTKELFGQEKNQLHEWDFQRTAMWKNEVYSNTLLIDLVTDYITEDLKTREPDIFTNGKLNDRACEINWIKEYNNVSMYCCQYSEFTPLQALRRRHEYLPADFEHKVRSTGTAYVQNCNSEAGRQFALECLARDFANNGLGKIDESQTPHIYTLTHEELATWLSEHKGRQGEITVELVSAGSSQRIYKAFNKSTIDAYIHFFRNGENYTVTGTKKLTRRLLLELLPKGRKVNLTFTSHIKANVEETIKRKSKQLRDKIIYLYANPFTDKNPSLVLNENCSQVLKRDMKIWEKFFTNNSCPLHILVTLKNNDRFTISSNDSIKLLSSIKDLIEHSNLMPASKNRFTKHLDLLINSTINPRLVLERIGRIPTEDRYSSIRLIEEFFVSGLSTIRKSYSSRKPLIEYDPIIHRQSVKRTILNVLPTASSNINNFIVESIKKEFFVYDRYRNRDIKDLENFAAEHEIEANDYYHAGNTAGARKTFILAECFERVKTKKSLGILKDPRSFTYEEFSSYATALCDDLGIKITEDNIKTSMQLLVRTNKKQSGIYTKLPSDFPTIAI